MGKVEELVERSHGKIRAHVIHERLQAMGSSGNEQTTRRAVAAAKVAYRAGRRRTYRSWLPEPGMWLRFDWGDGPRVSGRRTYLFCAWYLSTGSAITRPCVEQPAETSCREAFDQLPQLIGAEHEAIADADLIGQSGRDASRCFRARRELGSGQPRTEAPHLALLSRGSPPHSGRGRAARIEPRSRDYARRTNSRRAPTGP